MAIILTAYPSSLEVTRGEHILEGGIRNYDVEFRFPANDTTWRDMALVGVFETDLGAWSVFLDPETHTCKIPWEALDEGSAGSNLRVGLYGVREDDESFIVRSTVWAAMPFRILPGPDAEPAQEPTPSLFQQILSAVSQVVQRMTVIQTIEKTVFSIANRVTSLHQETEYNSQKASDSASAAETSADSAQASAKASANSAAEAQMSVEESAQNAQESAASRVGAELAMVRAEKAQADALASKAAADDILAETRDVLAETEQVLEDTREAELGAEAAQAGAESARDEAAEILTETRTVREGIDEALNDAEGAAQSADESARLAESWAVGGTGLRSGEDTDNARYYAQRAKNIAGGIDIVIGDTMPAIWPVLWFNTSGVIQPSDNEMLLLLGEWTEESDVQAEVDGDLYSVENAAINGEPTEGTYSFDVI